MSVTPQELAASRARLYSVDPDEDESDDDVDGPGAREADRQRHLEALIQGEADRRRGGAE